MRSFFQYPTTLWQRVIMCNFSTNLCATAEFPLYSYSHSSVWDLRYQKWICVSYGQLLLTHWMMMLLFLGFREYSCTSCAEKLLWAEWDTYARQAGVLSCVSCLEINGTEEDHNLLPPVGFQIRRIISNRFKLCSVVEFRPSQAVNR